MLVKENVKFFAILRDLPAHGQGSKGSKKNVIVVRVLARSARGIY
jgi:hypothetical protein